MWRAHVARSQSGTDVEQVVVHFREVLDLEKFRVAWSLVVVRTPILRMRFVWDREGEPRQVVVPQVEVAWTVLDGCRLGSDHRDQQWEDSLKSDRRQGFDLRTAPLLRFAWQKLGQAESRLLWTFHHILLDGRSMPMVLAEVFSAYHALCEERPVVFPERPGFDRFLRWQQRWWESHHSLAETFWRTYLKDLREPVVLAMDTAAGTYAPVSEVSKANFTLSATETAELQRAAEALGVTPNTVVQAAWGLLLRRHGGQEDVMFGVVRTGRGGTIPEAAAVIGLCMMSLPLRFDFVGSMSVAEMLQALRARHLALREFEHTPSDQLSHWSELPPGSPLFESVVVFDHKSVPDRMTELCGGHGRTFELLQQPDQPLLLSVTNGVRLAGHLIFDARRFPAPLMRRLANQFAHLLRELPRLPGRRFVEVPLLPPAERAELIAFGRGPETTGPSDRLLQGWFEESANKSPAAIAVRTPDGTTTYGQLEIRANQLAHHLQRLGAVPDRLVAICLPRSPELVTAILGVLKSGAAYLPIDPATPSERLVMMLGAARPWSVITAFGFQLPSSDASPLQVVLEDDHGRINTLPVGPPASLAAPGHLAYAIFTSGTTGTPKLVGVEHRNVSNLLGFATAELFRPADLACVPFTAAIGFDVCVHQIFATLAHGGTLVPLADLTALGGSPCFGHFTYLGGTPSILQRVCDAGVFPPALRLVGVGAEVTPPQLLERLRTHPSIREVYNFYGPTETTIYCTVARLIQPVEPPAGDAGLAERNLGRLIGRPIAGTRCLVLDERGEQVPVGVPGELVVAGAGVARGYLNDPSLTGIRFVAEPGDGSGNGRAYRTGDLVRWHLDGQLEFLGRRDSQVKINGVRVELEEIESHLRAVPQVTHAAVIVKSPTHGTAQLAAFVVMPASAFDSSAIRRFLRGRLPQALVPPTVVRVEALPLTATGKLDRQRLLQFEVAAITGLPRQQTLETETEKQLGAIWSRVLRQPVIRAEDDFFALGGDSLRAVVLLMAIEADFGTRLTGTDLADCSSLRELAARIDRNRAADDVFGIIHSQRREGSFVRLQSGGAKRPILILPGGIGENERPAVYRPIFQELSGHPAWCYQPLVLDHRRTPSHNLRVLLNDALEALRVTGVNLDDGVIIWGHCVGAVLGLEVARRLTGGGRGPVSVAMLDPIGPIGPVRAMGRAAAFSPLGVQLRYHRNMMNEGDWQARTAYARGVFTRAIRRAFWRPIRKSAGTPDPKASDLNRHYQDLVSYPRAINSHCARPHAGPLLVAANRAEASPDLEQAWRKLARGSFRFETIAGTHESVVTDHAAEIGGSLRNWLAGLATPARRQPVQSSDNAATRL